MKRWTRKLLAGLLSFGMLLQVASPLSALAADSSSAAPGLTVTVNDKAYTLAIDSSGQVIVPNEWTASNLPNVSYDATTTTYTLTGQLGSSSTGAVVLSGTGSPNLTLQNSTGGVVWAGQLDVTGVNNFKASTDSNSSAIRFNIISGCERNATINCTGNIEITAKDGNAVYDGALVVESAQSVTVKSTGSRSALSNYSTISCTGKVDIQNTGTGEAATVGLKVKNADSVALSSNNSDRTVGDLHVEQCSGSVEVTNSGSGRAIYNYLSVGKLDNGIYTYTASSVTINGNIGGYTRTYCNGDITINGAILGANSSKHTWRSDLMSQNGIVTVDGGAEAVPYLVGGSAHVMGAQVVLRGNATTTISRDYNQSGIKAETKVLTVENTGSGTVGYAKFTAEKGTDYDIYLDKGHATQTDVSLSDLNDNTNISSKYLYVSATEEAMPVAELEVTLTPMGGGTPETQQINPKTASIALGGKTINVAYDNGTYTLSGNEIGSYSTTSYATDIITIRGVNSGKDSANVKLAIIIHGNLVVKDIHDLEVTKRVSVQNSVTCTGNVTMTASMLAQSGLIVNAGGDVILTGTSASITIGKNGTTDWGAEITSGGDVLIENISGSVYSTPVSGGILVHAAKNVTIKSSSRFDLIRGSEKADITADTLTIISTNSNVGGPITFTPCSGSRDGYVIATGDSATAATAVQLESKDYPVDEKYLYIGPGTVTPVEPETPDNAELKITAGGKDYRIDPKDISEYGKEYTIGYDTFLISYHSEYDEFDIYGTVPDGTQIEGIGMHRPALQMTASTAGGIARPLTYGSLTIKNMGDVDLNGVIHENLTIENVKDVSSGVVGYAGSGNLIIDGAENVKYLTHVFGTIDINCTGEVNIYGSRNGSVSDGANITAKSLMMKSVSINGSVGNVGHVKFTRTDTAGNYRILTGENEDTITSQTAMNGEIFDQTVEETYLCIEPGTPHQHTLGNWEHDETNHWKICSGCNEKVDEAEHLFNSDGVCECGYKKPAPTPDHEHTLGDWEYNETKHWKTCSSCNEKVDEAEHNFGEDRKAEKCVECGFANPDYVEPAPDDTGTVDSGSDAGGAVAAVLVSGAAVWGGYEIATRVILHNILPEGTAIPANRGQLALLVWNNAGRPEPVNEPVFVDMDDTDMAKAAQWCVEQGIMEAKTTETFKPESWTPKFKVIEVWNKAFPKQ